MLPSTVEDLFKQAPWSQRHSSTVHLEVNWKQNISHWFCLPGCCLLSVRPRGCKQNESTLAGPGPPRVMWSELLIPLCSGTARETRVLLSSAVAQSHLGLCWKNAFFLFLDLNRSMPLNVFLWIQTALCCCAHGKAEAATCLDAAAGHL